MMGDLGYRNSQFDNGQPNVQSQDEFDPRNCSPSPPLLYPGFGPSTTSQQVKMDDQAYQTQGNQIIHSNIHSQYGDNTRHYSPSPPFLNRSDADHQSQFMQKQQQEQTRPTPTARPTPKPRRNIPSQNPNHIDNESNAFQNQSKQIQPQPFGHYRESPHQIQVSNFAPQHLNQRFHHQNQPSRYPGQRQLPNPSEGSSYSSIGSLYDSGYPQNTHHVPYDSMYSPINPQIAEIRFPKNYQIQPQPNLHVLKNKADYNFSDNIYTQPKADANRGYIHTEAIYDRSHNRDMHMQQKPKSLEGYNPTEKIYERNENQDLPMQHQPNAMRGYIHTEKMYERNENQDLHMQQQPNAMRGYIHTEKMYERNENQDLHMQHQPNAMGGHFRTEMYAGTEAQGVHRQAKVNAENAFIRNPQIYARPSNQYFQRGPNAYIPSPQMYDSVPNQNMYNIPMGYHDNYSIWPNQIYPPNSIQSMSMYEHIGPQNTEIHADVEHSKPDDPMKSPIRSQICSTQSPASAISPPRNIPKIIERYRDAISELIKENKSLEERRNVVMELLINFEDSSVKKKYIRLPFISILNENVNNDIGKLPMALKVLGKYASNLLKHESERHSSWRRVSFLSSAFQQHVRPLRGNRKILFLIGYTVEVPNENDEIVAVSFPESEIPDPKSVTEVATDLCIAKIEIEEILEGSHPHFQLLKDPHFNCGIPPIFFAQSKSVLPETPPKNMAVEIVQPQQIIKGPESPTYYAEVDKNYGFRSKIAQPVPVLSPQNQTIDRKTERKPLEDLDEKLNEADLLYCPKCCDKKHGSFCLDCGTKLFGNIPPTNVIPARNIENNQGLPQQQQQNRGKGIPSVYETLSEAPRHPPIPKMYNTALPTDTIKLSNVNIVKGDPNYDNNRGGRDKVGAKWQCEHCTFLNSPATRVCEMCDRTSWHKDQDVADSTNKEKDAELKNVDVREMAGNDSTKKPNKDVEDSKDRGTENKNQKNVDRHHDGTQIVSSTEEFTNFKTYDVDNFVLIESQQDNPETKGKATSAPPVVSRSHEETAAYKKVARELEHLSSDEGPEISKEKKEAIFSRFESRDAERKAREKEQERKAAMQRMAMENERKKCEENARHLVQLFKFAEHNGFTVDECYIAASALHVKNIQLSEGNVQHWLENDWIEILKDTMKECNLFYGGASSNHNNINTDIGFMTIEEAKRLMIQNNGDRKKCIEQFLLQRKDKIKSIQKQLPNAKKCEIIEALNSTNGFEEEAKDLLCKAAFGGFLKRIDEPLDKKKFFEKLKDKNVPQKTKCLMLLCEGFFDTWGYAQNCCLLIEANLNSERLDIHDFVTAAKSSPDIKKAQKFLGHVCCTCYGEFPVSKIINSTQCECEYCYECFSESLKTTITEKDISNLKCAFCEKELVFAHLEQRIKEFVKTGFMEKVNLDQFHTKLLDFANQTDENFRYCGHCPAGFLWENPNQIKMTCDSCRKHTCFNCKIKWPPQHEGRTCEEYEQWKYMNENPFNEKDIAAMFDRTELTCPSPTCPFRFEMARGGCMHFICSKCKYQFCGGCYREMVDSNKQQRSEFCDDSCAIRGLHTHHPRDCGFFLRDWEVNELQALLQLHEIPYETEVAEDRQGENPVTCIIKEQKEEKVVKEDGTDGTRLFDERCGGECESNMAGVCKKHYKEYLMLLINRYGIDPVDTMPIEAIDILFKRHKQQLPPQNPDEANADYLTRVRQLAKNIFAMPQRKKHLHPKELQEAPAAPVEVGEDAQGYQRLDNYENEEVEEDILNDLFDGL